MESAARKDGRWGHTKSDPYANVRYERQDGTVDDQVARPAAMEMQTQDTGMDPLDDMRLVPYRPTPPMQILLSFMAFSAMLFAMVALIYDEISDGDVEFISDTYSGYNFKEIDYDCGWEKWTITQKYNDGYEYAEVYYYGKAQCTEYFESDSDTTDAELENFCSEMKQHGYVWLSLSILGIKASFVAMLVVWRYGPKSVCYFMASMVSLIMLAAASLNWMTNERCTDIEHWSDSDVLLDTSMGVSLILMFTAVGIAAISALISSVMIGSEIHQKRQQRHLGVVQSE